MPKFDTIVDDVIASVHDAIKKDIVARAQTRSKNSTLRGDGEGITEEYFAENRDALKEFLKKELNILLNTKCNAEFLDKYIKYSSRYYIRYYKFGPAKRMGNQQLTRFFEARIDYVLESKADSKNKDEVKEYLRDKKLIDQPKDNKSKAEITEEIKEELRNFLLSNKVNLFWIGLETQKAKQQENERIDEEQELKATQQESLPGSVQLTFVTDEQPKKRFKDECHWYKYNSTNDPLKAFQLIRQIENLCEYYIKNRYAKLKKLQALLPNECELKPRKEIQTNIPFAISDTESKVQLPTEFDFDAKQIDKSKHPIIDEITTVTQQYNKMQQLRLMLHDPKRATTEKITLFRDAYVKKENQAILHKDIDGPLKKVLFAISNLITGQFFLRGTFMFWKTDPQIISDIIASYNPPKSIARKTKLNCNHTVASSRSSRH